jgi:hypothetical protein
MAAAAAPGRGVKRVRRASVGWCLRGCVGAALVLGGAPRSPAAAPVAPAGFVAAPARNAARTTSALVQTHLLIISGVSAEPRFATELTGTAAALRDAAITRFGIPDSLVTWLAEDPAADSRRITGKSSREGIAAAVEKIAARAQPNDRIFILLMGHGSSEGEVSRFNIPGPDLTDADFAKLLARFAGQDVVFVNASSASGGFVKTLSGPRRTIVTATKSGMERNASVFARYFVQAYTAEGADADKDGRVSLLEAFQFARREVQRDYEQGGRILTEHAVLDDDGDGTGHTDASEKGPDGARARGFYLAAGTALSSGARNDPRAAALVAERESLQARIDSLRARKATMKDADYSQALEGLLLKLAETSKAIRELEAKKP